MSAVLCATSEIELCYGKIGVLRYPSPGLDLHRHSYPILPYPKSPSLFCLLLGSYFSSSFQSLTQWKSFNSHYRSTTILLGRRNL
jgi:hypothetical protein